MSGPIFIVGPMGSGTTLMRLVLDDAGLGDLVEGVARLLDADVATVDTGGHTLAASGAAGAAARAATDLRRLGVRVVGTGNAATPTGQASTLAYPPALARQARLLASVLGGKVKLVKAGDGASLTLTVGSGFRLR